MRRRILLIASIVLVAIGISVIPMASADVMPPILHPSTVTQTDCPTGWGSQPKVVTPMSQGTIEQVRVGRHPCFDRLVFDTKGKPGGYRVEYVPVVYSEGEGAPLNVPGGAKLSINILNPTSHSLYWAVNGSVKNVSKFDTFRSVVYGGSFEGHSQFGLGVRARLPFRVFSLNGSHLVVDVAHHWN